jgi:dimethylamine/trimethylamine dehydrogenase
MPASTARIFPDYASALLIAYEEEVSGEGYFAGLADQFTGRPREALLLMARVERVTASALRQLIVNHGLSTEAEAVLLARGRAQAEMQRGITWESLTASMAEDYPVFMEEFGQLSQLAPETERERTLMASEHELALIAFAQREVSGDPGSLTTLEQFLSRHDGPRRN